MPDFAGMVSTTGSPIDPDWVEKLQSPFSATRSAEYRDDVAVLIQAPAREHGGEDRGEPTLSRRGAMIGVGDIRIDNLSEVRHRVSQQPDVSDCATLLAVLESNPDSFPADVLGAYSCAIWDAALRRLVCVRDHFGVRPLYYAFVRGIFVFSSDLRSITALGGEYRELDSVRLAQYLENEPTDEERTFYLHIKRLPRSSTLTLRRGSIQLSRYWSPTDIVDSPQSLSDNELIDEFRNIFVESVRCRIDDSAMLGSLLSGGLDSSSVTCVARELLDPGRPLTALSAVFPGIEEPHRRAIDESPFIDAVCELDGIRSVRLEGDRLTPLSGLEELLSVHGQPFDPPNAYLDFAMCGLAAEQRVDVLLDGLEGDITVSHGVHFLDELAARGQWSAFLREANMMETRLGLNRDAVFRRYGLEMLATTGLRRFLASVGRLMLAGRVELAARSVRARYRGRRGGRGTGPGPRLISEDLAREVRWSERPHYDDRDEHYVSERAAHLAFLGKPYIQAIMEFTHANGRHFGIEVRHPMFDRRIVDFAVCLPPRLKLNNGWTRYVLRAAMSGIVPDTVRWRPGKATLAPNFDLKMIQREQERVEAILRNSESTMANLVKKDVLWMYFREHRSRALWPALVLASFLK